MPQVLTLTLNPTIDVSGEAEAVRPIRKVRTSGTRFDPGGGGINVARVVTLLGGDAEAVYLGGGEVGEILDRLLAEKGVRTHKIAIEGQTRLGFIVHEHSTGLEYRFVPEGAPVAAASLREAFDYVRSHPAEYVVGSGSLPEGAPVDFYAELAADVAARGGRFVVDTSGPALRATLEKATVFLAKPSLGELEEVAGRKLDAESAGEAAAEIVARGAAELVAVTLGPDGAILASRSGITRLPTIPVRVRSATGAGDSFLAAMVCAFLEGRSEDEAFRFGIAAGAAAAMTPGTELCRRQDVFDLYERCKAL
ncbi:1-phosphofructokinase family hexose kinase [Aquibium oceanicum]|uniref:Phosphofructokinase n=1 Tax=Aquibium oceanicum TaxID=1670800 RepID=A0A1L3SL27_9HYPH|nr:1-phosphofructokinase family hexose kinase [Aquibium oceanicum]APH70106.1 1-phosphofructokinase [Aquibium oceanicum]